MNGKNTLNSDVDPTWNLYIKSYYRHEFHANYNTVTGVQIL